MDGSAQLHVWPGLALNSGVVEVATGAANQTGCSSGGGPRRVGTPRPFPSPRKGAKSWWAAPPRLAGRARRPKCGGGHCPTSSTPRSARENPLTLGGRFLYVDMRFGGAGIGLGAGLGRVSLGRDGPGRVGGLGRFRLMRFLRGLVCI